MLVAAVLFPILLAIYWVINQTHEPESRAEAYGVFACGAVGAIWLAVSTVYQYRKKE